MTTPATARYIKCTQKTYPGCGCKGYHMPDEGATMPNPATAHEHTMTARPGMPPGRLSCSECGYETNHPATAQPTPGPWYASASTENGITVHRDSTGTLLATIRALDVKGAGAANARLIAAAPALLAALETLQDAIAGVSASDYKRGEALTAAAYNARAAIRAAKGK